MKAIPFRFVRKIFIEHIEFTFKNSKPNLKEELLHYEQEVTKMNKFCSSKLVHH